MYKKGELYMKRILSCIFLVFLLVFGGCQKEDIIEEAVTEVFEVSNELFLYEEAKEVDVMTVDENGYLYTATCITNIDEATVKDDFIQQFKVYDLEGNCVKEIEIALGTGNINFLSVENGMLYCIAMKSELAVWGPTLYTINTTTWEVSEVYQFETYSYIINFAHVGDYFYAIGTLKEVPEKEYDEEIYTYQGECVSRIKVGEHNPKEEILPIDFPINIVGTKQDTLAIYHYNEEKGFGFLEFEPKKAVLEEVGWSEKHEYFSGLIQCRDGFLTSKFGKIFYGTVNNVEAQILEKDSRVFAYQKGFLFYLTKEGVERIGIDDLIRGNTPIRMLLPYENMREPYDNGYLIEKTILGPENYALKVLAQDSDFDMYLLESREDISYNIKEKGAFYALNEVEGVQEYLDACFPYIKEVATNEEGDIWMIPVEPSITSLLYYKEYNEKENVDLSSMDFLEFLSFVEEVETKESEKGSISMYMLVENMFFQYLSVYDSFDTDEFRKYARQLKQMEENAGRFVGEIPYITSVRRVSRIEDDPAYTQEELQQIPYFYYGSVAPGL